MKNIFTEMNQISDHFFKESDKFIKNEKEKQTQDWSAFKTFNVGGKQVVDLTSIDEIPQSKLLSDDIERNKRYDFEKSSNPRWK